MPPSLPEVIGKYTVDRFIESGGMGDVYLARDPQLDRPVAIKFLREGFDSEEMRERFEREARAAGRLSHPNIVTIYEFGEYERRPFIAMEYVRGEPLSKLIRRQAPIPVIRKLELAEGLCSGLAHAHKANIVHRDVKPANLMVDNDGPLKILDFGIVRMAGSGLTAHGIIVGTVNYMSPEQIDGSRPIDLRSDVFAVGSVLYELFTYQRAFPGQLKEALHKIVHKPPQPATELAPDLDPGIVKAIEQCLQKSPDRRYQELGLLRRDLSRIRQRLELEDSSTHSSGMTALRKALDAKAAPKPAAQAPVPQSEEARRERARTAEADQARLARERGEQERLEEARKAREEADKARADTRRLQRGKALVEARQQVAARRYADALATLRPWVNDAGDEPGLAALLEQAEAGQRAAAVHDAPLASARELMAREDFAAASRLVQGVLKIDPAHAAATALEREIVRGVEMRGKTTSTLQRARALSATNPAEAIAMLERFTPAHADVAALLAELRGRQAGLARDQARVERGAQGLASIDAAMNRLARLAREKPIVVIGALLAIAAVVVIVLTLVVWAVLT